MHLSHFCYHHLLPSALWRITDITKQFPVERWKIDKASSRVMAVMAVMALFLYKACCSYWPSRRRSWSILEAKGPLNRMTRHMTRRMTLEFPMCFCSFRWHFWYFGVRFTSPGASNQNVKLNLQFPKLTETLVSYSFPWKLLCVPLGVWVVSCLRMNGCAGCAFLHSHACLHCVCRCRHTNGRVSFGYWAALSLSRSVYLFGWLFLSFLQGDPKKFISWFTLLFNHNDNDDLPMTRTRVPQTTLLPV